MISTWLFWIGLSSCTFYSLKISTFISNSTILNSSTWLFSKKNNTHTLELSWNLKHLYYIDTTHQNKGFDNIHKKERKKITIFYEWVVLKFEVIKQWFSNQVPSDLLGYHIDQIDLYIHEDPLHVTTSFVFVHRTSHVQIVKSKLIWI